MSRPTAINKFEREEFEMKKWLLGAVTALAGLSSVATANSFTCSGNVLVLLVYADGSVNVKMSWRNDFTYICNIRQSRLGVDPITCAMWMNTINAVRAQGGTISAYYTVTPDSSCTALPTYTSSPAPVYFGF